MLRGILLLLRGRLVPCGVVVLLLRGVREEWYQELPDLHHGGSVELPVSSPGFVESGDIPAGLILPYLRPSLRVCDGQLVLIVGPDPAVWRSSFVGPPFLLFSPRREICGQWPPPNSMGLRLRPAQTWAFSQYQFAICLILLEQDNHLQKGAQSFIQHDLHTIILFKSHWSLHSLLIFIVLCHICGDPCLSYIYSTAYFLLCLLYLQD